MKSAVSKILRHDRIHVFLIAVAYMTGLWRYSVPFTGDQKVYLSTALEMWRSKVWLYPILMGEHTYIKPPLGLWATLTGWTLFGFNPFGTFIPSVVALILTCAFLEGISRDLNQRKGPVLSSLWFATTFGAMTYACVAQMDIWLALGITAAWWAAVRYWISGRARFIYMAFIFAGLCALVKSPLHSVLWTLGLGIFFLFPGRKKPWRDPHLYCAVVFGVGVSLTWFITVYFTDYQAFWVGYVRGETLAKAGGNHGPLFNMWRDFVISMAPWAIVILAATFAGLRKWGTKDVKTRLLISWCAPAMVFFSVFPYRTETYLFIALPAFALAADWALSERRMTGKFLPRTMKLNALVLAVLVAAVSLMFLLSGVVSLFWALCIACAGFASSILMFQSQPRPALVAALLLVLSVRLAATSLGEDDVSGLRQFARIYPNRSLVYQDISRNWWSEIGLLSVAARKPSERLMKEEEVRRSLSAGAALVLSNDEWPVWIPRIKKSVEKSGRSGKLREYSWWRWNRGFMFPGFKDLHALSDRGSPEWNARFRREFKIIYWE